MNTKTIILILVLLYLLYRNNKKENFTCIDNATDAILGTCSDIDDTSDLINVSGTTLEVDSIGLTNTTSDKIGFIDITTDKITVQGSSLNGMINDDKTISVDKLILPEDASLCFSADNCIDKTYNNIISYKKSDDYGLTSYSGNGKINESTAGDSSILGDAGSIYLQYVAGRFTDIKPLKPGIHTFPSYVKLPRRFDIKPGYTIKCFISNNTLLTADGETENDFDYNNLYCEFKNTSDKTLVIYTSEIINYKNVINVPGYNKVVTYNSTESLGLGKHDLTGYFNNDGEYGGYSNYLLYRPANLNKNDNDDKCYDDDDNELTSCNLNGGIMYDNLSEYEDNQYDYTIKKLEDDDDYIVIDVFGSDASDYITYNIGNLGLDDKYIYLNTDLIDSESQTFNGMYIPFLPGTVPRLELIRTIKINKL